MQATKKNSKKRLTNASKRVIITLGIVMVKIHHNGLDIECETAAEAIEVLQHIAEKREEASELASQPATVPWHRRRLYVWKAKSFQNFIDALGDTQQCILRFLTRHGMASDKELREVVGVTSNQQLAGILSGVSKQAAALNIPARSVYTMEIEIKAGKTEKNYMVAPDFFEIATQMNWPSE